MANQLITFNSRERALIWSTACKDIDNQTDVDWCITFAEMTGFNPLRREIYFMVYNKNDPAKRKIVPVVGIDGWRRKAEETGKYRPDDEPAKFEIKDELKNPKTNPLGIESCTTKIWKKVDDDWFPTVTTVYWDEFVPIDKYGKAGEHWIKRGRNQIAKCGEAQNFRKAFPTVFEGIYEPTEWERSMVNITPTEDAKQWQEGQRKQLAKAVGHICFEDLTNEKEMIPFDQYAAKVEEMVETNDALSIKVWLDRNKIFFNQFWAEPGRKAEAMELRKMINDKIGELV